MKRWYKIIAVVVTVMLLTNSSVWGQMQKAEAGSMYSLRLSSELKLKLPKRWKNNYVLIKKNVGKKDFFASFCAKKCYKETGEGFLFAIARYTDNSYQELPSYEVAGRWKGVSYVAEFPTDVQFMGASKAAARQYHKLSGDIDKILKTVQP